MGHNMSKCHKYIKHKIKQKDKYTQIEFGSNLDKKKYTSTWKPGGIMIGVSGKWASKVERLGSDQLGRWIWVDLRGENNKVIRIISAYRLSQESHQWVGRMTS